MAVLDDVADAGWRSRVVLQNHQGAVLVSDEVGAADVDVGAMREIDALHDGTVVGIAEYEVGRDHAILDDLLVVVEIVQQEVERGDALDHARARCAPTPGLRARAE